MGFVSEIGVSQVGVKVGEKTGEGVWGPTVKAFGTNLCSGSCSVIAMVFKDETPACS